ncbi:trypsin-5-like [Scylla paramamosain]|uniref:trypsin-5-like n=1 Tax=Scylla paramamosain TaxID=85552 RepID=UPI003082FF75
MLTVFLVILATAAALGLGQEVGDSCTTDSGEAGRCTNLQQCPSLHNTLSTHKPVTCGFEGIVPIVCCPSTGDVIPKSPDVTPSSATFDVSPPQVSFECGISRPRIIRKPESSFRRRRSSSHSLHRGDVGRSKRSVVGGITSKVDAWPWMTLLGKSSAGGNTWFCGGVLINEQWVLSALHCFFDITANVVRLGEHDYNDNEDGANHKDVKVADVVLYPHFNPGTAYHDLALLKLESKVTIQRSIRPVCLPWGTESEKNITGETATLTGWGDTSFGGFSSSVLQEVDLVTFPSAQCDSSYSSLPHYADTWPQGIGQETLCAGDPAGGRDACQGDSGGPLVSKDANGRFVLAGIVSRGYGCGHEDYPGLYASIRHPPYLAWIKEVAFSSP